MSSLLLQHADEVFCIINIGGKEQGLVWVILLEIPSPKSQSRLATTAVCDEGFKSLITESMEERHDKVETKGKSCKKYCY